MAAPAAGRTTAATLPWGRALLLTGVLLVVGSDLYLVAPLLPLIRRALGVGLPAAGLLVSGFAAAYTLASPALGRVSDRFGRRRTLLGGLGLFVLAEWASALAPDYPALLAARVAAGVAAAAVTPAVYAQLGDEFPYGRRGLAMGLASAGFALATVAGVPLGLLLAGVAGWRGTLAVLAAAAMAAAVGLALRLPPAGPGPDPAGALPPLPWARVWRVQAASLAAFAALGLVYTYLPAALGRAGMGRGAIAGVLAVYGLLGLGGNLGWGVAGDRLGKRRATLVAMGAQGATLPLLAWAAAGNRTAWWLAAAWGFGAAGAYIAQLKALASAVPAAARGRSLAWNNAALYAGLSLGSAAGGVLVARWGYPAAAWAALPLLAAGWGLLAAGPQTAGGGPPARPR
ncbi:MFS domain-containing protein [Candidatus Hydrogenisulfobacillus filiaventi]|uniref:MFS domain-containing protein n=1 Tax=Candidatus Hydrogenisulfobacillus filiaventi TaxID=2707344 RepID=A0A6F8ZE11_9FIRM|nr:MFS domain-containing protein [Candidatus Hydrogenisulfobacillus filiaventi]